MNMKKLTYLYGPIVLAMLLFAVGNYLINNIFPSLLAVSIPTTFTNGSVLTASQLNSNNTAIYNAFNSHNHDGSDGEPSTLAFTTASASFNASGDITFNGASSSLECDGTTATDLLLDQANKDVIIGGGDKTTQEELTIRANTGDAALSLRVNNSSSNTWTMSNENSSSDTLTYSYNSSDKVLFLTDGRIAAGGQASTEAIAWEAYSGTTCSPASCTTTVDASAPGTGRPLSFSCCVGSATVSVCNTSLAVPKYDDGADALTIDISSATFAGQSYNCIVFYGS